MSLTPRLSILLLIGTLFLTHGTFGQNECFRECENDSCTLSEADCSCGLCSSTCLEGGTVATCFCTCPSDGKVLVGDTVFLDIIDENLGDGIFDFEPAIENAQVVLFDSNMNIIDETRSNFDGHYHFELDPSTDYTICVNTSSTAGAYERWPTKSNQGDDDNVDSDGIKTEIDLGSGTPEEASCATITSPSMEVEPRADWSVDFGFVQAPAGCGDKVWFDDNGDGIQDFDEPGIPAARVILFDFAGNKLQEQFTNEDGEYLFQTQARELLAVCVAYKDIQMPLMPTLANQEPQDRNSDGLRMVWQGEELSCFGSKEAPRPGVDNLDIDFGFTLMEVVTDPPTMEPPFSFAPTAIATDAPTDLATDAPTAQATDAPTDAPTAQATDAPTAEVTDAPTAEATDVPTDAPTAEVTDSPTSVATNAPTTTTDTPTAIPTAQATIAPTAQATDAPTAEATDAPTAQATDAPTAQATDAPTEQATDAPTAEATAAPTAQATDAPTAQATDAPTAQATDAPTAQATDAPTAQATDAPTAQATAAPTAQATMAPTAIATNAPTAGATDAPTSFDTTAPMPLNAMVHFVCVNIAQDGSCACDRIDCDCEGYTCHCSTTGQYLVCEATYYRSVILSVQGTQCGC